MKHRNCVVLKCPTNNINPDKRGSVFCLPRNDEKRSRWLQLLGRDDLVEMPYVKTLTCGFGVCYLHFTDRHYRTSEKKSLNTNASPTPIPGVRDIPTTQKSKIPILPGVRNIQSTKKPKIPILSDKGIPATQKSKTSPILSGIREIPSTQKSKTPILSDIREIPLTRKSNTAILSGVREIPTKKSKTPILSDRKIPATQKSKTSPILSGIRKVPTAQKSTTSPISIVVPESEIIINDQEISDPLSVSPDNKSENYYDNPSVDNLIKNPKKRRKRNLKSKTSPIVSDIKKVPTTQKSTSPISLVVPESEIITNDQEIFDPLSLSPDNKIRNYSEKYDNSSVGSFIKNPKKRRKIHGRLSDLLDENGPKKQYMRAKIEEYMKRAETIKNLIANLKEQGNNHEQIIIENNSKGHSYEVIFKRFLDSEVTSVIIEDPYIRLFHQCQNLVMFCELLVRNCSNLKNIQLVTIKDQKADQEKCFQELQQSLVKFNISLIITYSSTLHDRQIKFSTGWTIKIGRGLDYFKKSDGKFSIGTFDYNLRPCHETTVDVFHQSNVKQIYG